MNNHPQAYISKHRRRRVLDRYPRCVYCGCEFWNYWERNPTIDHVLPISRGGTKDEKNLVGCCRACNAAKGDRTPEEWAAAILEAAKVIEATNRAIVPFVRQQETKPKGADDET